MPYLNWDKSLCARSKKEKQTNKTTTQHKKPTKKQIKNKKTNQINKTTPSHQTNKQKKEDKRSHLQIPCQSTLLGTQPISPCLAPLHGQFLLQLLYKTQPSSSRQCFRNTLVTVKHETHGDLIHGTMKDTCNCCCCSFLHTSTTTIQGTGY